MPYWAVAIIILVLVVGYYLLTQQARERRREKVGTDFGRIPNFYANQTYSDAAGDAAIGIDDRGRRIAVARKRAQPRTQVYSFAHIISAEVVQNGRVIASITSPAATPHRESGGESGGSGGLFGSTGPAARQGPMGQPVIKAELGQLTMLGLKIEFRNGAVVDEVLLRFYEGKPVNVDGVVGEKALADAQVLLGALDVAVKRAGTPPRGPALLRTPVR